jgi:prepilin-type N-terminal cleavage/methylation domain-containing protein
MKTPGRTARGFTLIEVMLSSLILVVAITGFIALVQLVMSANATAHRRTVGSYVRGALLDRLTVTPRRIVGSLPQNAWFIDECYDANAQPVGQNLLHESAWQCPSGSGLPVPVYRRWIRVTTLAGVASAYTLSVYVERIDSGCLPEQRHSALGCMSADLYVTD